MKFKLAQRWFAVVAATLSLSSWAAGMGAGTLTLRDAFGSGNGGWKPNVSAMEVHVPLVVVDAVGRAIEGFDATLQLGGEGGLADAGYKLNASGKMVETTWWGTLNQSIFHLVGRQQLHLSNGATYNFDHAEISMNGGASWNTVYCDTPSCIANPQQCMDVCCQSCSSSDFVESYGWYAYDTSGNRRRLSNDSHTVQIKTVYRLAATEKSYGTLTLVDGFEREWKASVARATTIHVPLEFYDTANNPIEDHYDATFELGETSGHGNAGYVLNANEGLVETGWGSMNQSLFYLIGRREWRATDNTRYMFDHAEISMDGGSTWAPVFTDTPSGSANPRQLLDFCCYDCSSDSYTGEYGWKIRSTTGDEHFIDDDGHSIRLRVFYRPTLLGDAYTVPTLDALKTGITFRLFDYTDDVNSAANGLEGYFNFRANTMDTSVYRNYINENTDADGFTPAHATVLPTLVEGFPVFSGTRNGVHYCDDKSLRYLFDGSAHGVGVTEYPVANTPLILQGDGSYAYDSRTNACDYDEERHLLLVRNYVERTSSAAEFSSRDSNLDYYDFLPFAHWDGMTRKTYTDGNFPSPYEYEQRDTAYWFGYTMEYDFVTPAANVADSSFIFSGDDDVWVFIDDVLVLDLGGTHGMCTGTIDFKTGDVTAHIDWLGDQSSHSYPTTIRTQFVKAGQTYVDREEWVGNTFCPNTRHRLKMFYLERGGAVANCNVRFSMAVTPEVFTMPKSLWITDHRDAGEGAVFLAFQPIFDEEVELRGWIDKANAEKRIKVAFGKTPEQIATAVAAVAPLRAPDGQQDVDKGWVWIKVKLPEEGVGAEGLLWKVVIDGVAGQDFCSSITSADETRNADKALATGLPLVVIDTDSGVDPTCTAHLPTPTGWGVDIQDVNKEPGRLRILSGADTLYDSGEYVSKTSGITVKVRGNTSATADKKPYKIKLQKKADLLRRSPDKPHKDKDWVLMASATTLNNTIGCAVNDIVGLQWTPQFEYVNLVINGVYRGLYMLGEGEGRNETGRINIAEDGYLFEMDAYWWHENGNYFKTPFCPNPVGYTFKYPDLEDYEDPSEERTSIVQSISNTMVRVEHAIADGTYPDRIDVSSFASWLLGHDILGTYDSGGSNIYLTKYDNAEDTKVCMANMWDFDSVFQCDGWAGIHGGTHFYFPSLINNGNRTFNQTYRAKWNGIKSQLCSRIASVLDGMETSGLSAAIDKSRALDATKWGAAFKTFAEDRQAVETWFANRVQWIDSHLGEMPTGE